MMAMPIIGGIIFDLFYIKIFIPIYIWHTHQEARPPPEAPRRIQRVPKEFTRAANSSQGYYEIVSFVLAPRCLVPEPTFAGLADSAAALIRPAVPRTALRSRWGELTGLRELHIPNLSPLCACRHGCR